MPSFFIARVFGTKNSNCARILKRKIPADSEFPTRKFSSVRNAPPAHASFRNENSLKRKRTSDEVLFLFGDGGN